MDIEQAMLDPSRVFMRPDDVCNESSLTRDQKINVLRRWEYDARELGVAEEENMGGGPPDILEQVLKALQCLDAAMDIDPSHSTKLG